MKRKIFKYLVMLVALMGLSFPIISSTSSTVSARRSRWSLRQVRKLAYHGKAKLRKTVNCYRVRHHYYAGQKLTIKKGTRVHLSVGAGIWVWTLKYKGKKYFYLKDPVRSPHRAIGWFREI